MNINIMENSTNNLNASSIENTSTLTQVDADIFNKELELASCIANINKDNLDNIGTLDDVDKLDNLEPIQDINIITNTITNNTTSIDLEKLNNLEPIQDINIITNTITNNMTSIDLEKLNNLEPIQDINKNNEVELLSSEHITKDIKNAKSGKEFIHDVKYIYEKLSIDSEANEALSNTIDSDFGTILRNLESSVIKDSYNNSNETNLNSNTESTEGDLFYLDNPITTELTLEEEIARASNDEIQSLDILEQFKNGLSNTSTTKHIQIILKPRSLGTLNLNIKFINNAMHVDIYVDNAEVQKLLAHNLLELEQIMNPEKCLNIETINIIQKQDNMNRDRHIFDKNISLKETLKKYNQMNAKPIFLFK